LVVRLWPWHRITFFSRQRQIAFFTVVSGGFGSSDFFSGELFVCSVSPNIGFLWFVSVAGLLFCLFGLVRLLLVWVLFVPKVGW
jgi:hypothetical protein